MTYEESLEAIYTIQSNYPNFYIRQTAEQADIMTQTWAVAFNDYEKDIVMKALMLVIVSLNYVNADKADKYQLGGNEQ